MARPRFPLRLRDATDAVSPVIGVILMVAITVVLAATVFLLVNDFSQEPNPAPDVAFDVEQNDRGLKVVKSQTGLEWGLHLEISGSCADNGVELNGVAWPPPPGTPVLPGDFLGSCEAGETLIVRTVNPSHLIIQTMFQ